MKKLVLSSMLLLATTFLVSAQTKDATDQSGAAIEFDNSKHDFGTVEEGTLATYEFTFKNTGDKPLILNNVSASCGCTTPKWSKEPIKPGEKGSITAVYNSNGRPGKFNKSITISSNAITPVKVVTITGNVTPKPKEPVSPVVVPQD